MTTEGIVYQARLHWIILAWPVLLFLAALGIFFGYPALHQPALLMAAVLGVWVVMTWFLYLYSFLTVYDHLIEWQQGLWSRKMVSIQYSKIESIDIRKTIVGSMLGYGTLEIVGTGGTRERIDFLSKPLTCRRYIEQQMNVDTQNT